MSNTTQLTSFKDYDFTRLIFAEPKTESAIGDNGQPITYKRVNISTQNPDGTVGQFVTQTPDLFSFGIQDKFVKKTGMGKTLHLSIYEQDGPTDDQKTFFEFMNEVQDQCKQHLLTLGLKQGKSNLALAHLDEMSWCKFGTKEKPDDNKPNLYAKLFESAKSGDAKILTKFYDKNDVEIDPQTLIGARGRCQCALRIESIFAGTKYAINIKVSEAIFEVQDSSMKKRLLPRSTKPSLSNDETNDVVISSVNPLLDTLQTEDDDVPQTRLTAPEKKVKSVKKKSTTD